MHEFNSNTNIITYRAWDEEKGLMLYEDIPVYYDDDSGLHSGTEDKHGDWYNLILLQALDIKDKNYKTIYEGDVVVCWNDEGFLENFNKSFRYIIAYDGVAFVGMYHGLNNDFLANNMWYKFENIEVIGNIYEQPELKEFQISQLK